MIIKKCKVYIIDSLTFQLKNLNGISVIDAKSKKSYVCVYKNKKCVFKPNIIPNTQLPVIKSKYKLLTIYENYKNVDVFKNLLALKSKFVIAKNI
ncbi:MAG: hypothetical protein K2L48_02080, partial [Mycoplasmoidaceae bacterium]|nr:hypothetical protein [Mycoplasmoidaceae bacterium]